MLLDDFGDARLRETLDAEPGREAELYALAVDLLVHLHARAPMPGLLPHGLEQWLDELQLFPDWYCAALGLDVDVEAYRRAWRAVLAPVADDGSAPVTVLRDYHAENIMLVSGRGGIRHFGLLDFQDAMVGHPVLLASCSRIARTLRRPSTGDARPYRRHRPRRGLRNRLWALAAQRNTRILGVFTRLWKRDNKPQYTAFQPRMWGLLERDLAQPALAPVRAWFDASVPPGKRAAAWAHAE